MNEIIIMAFMVYNFNIAHTRTNLEPPIIMMIIFNQIFLILFLKGNIKYFQFAFAIHVISRRCLLENKVIDAKEIIILSEIFLLNISFCIFK